PLSLLDALPILEFIVRNKILSAYDQVSLVAPAPLFEFFRGRALQAVFAQHNQFDLRMFLSNLIKRGEQFRFGGKLQLQAGDLDSSRISSGRRSCGNVDETTQRNQTEAKQSARRCPGQK